MVDAAIHAAESTLSGDLQPDVPDIIGDSHSDGISEENPSRLLQGSRESAQHSGDSTSEHDACEGEGQRQRDAQVDSDAEDDDDTHAALEVDSINREVGGDQAAMDVDDMDEELPTRNVRAGTVVVGRREAEDVDALDVDSLAEAAGSVEHVQDAEQQADSGRMMHSQHDTTRRRGARMPVSSAIHTLEHRNVTPMCKATVYVERVTESLHPASAVDIDDLPATPSEVMVCAAAEVSRSVAAATAALSGGVLLETGMAHSLSSHVAEEERSSATPARVEGVEKDEREEGGEVDVPGYDFSQPPRFKQWLPTPSYEELQSARGGSREKL